MKQSNLTSDEIKMLRTQLRQRIAMSALEADFNATQLFRLLVVEEGEWTVKAASEYLRIPRTTLRRSVDAFIERGTFYRRPGGSIGITDEGMARCIMLHRETMAIATGERGRFSAEYLQVLRQMAMKKDTGARPSENAQDLDISDPDCFLIVFEKE